VRLAKNARRKTGRERGWGGRREKKPHSSPIAFPRGPWHSKDEEVADNGFGTLVAKTKISKPTKGQENPGKDPACRLICATREVMPSEQNFPGTRNNRQAKHRGD